jgi:hypothetical protein
MSFGYIGDTSTKIKQIKQNAGVLSIEEAYELEKLGHLGGSLQLIAETSHSSDVSTIELNSIKEAEYDVHLLVISNLEFESGIGRIGVQLRESGTYETAGVYDYSLQYQESSGGNGNQRQENYEYMQLEFQLSAAGTMSCYAYFYNLGNSAKHSYMNFQEQLTTSSYASSRFGAGILPQASIIDGIRIMRSGSNNFLSYNIKLFGVKK